MKYFTEDYCRFFEELAINNNKDWFHANKKRYETNVKKPFEGFLTNLIAEIQKHDSELNLEPKDCISRINRDIRFSKDKTPYNLHFNAFVSKGGKKDKSIPGIYIRFGADEIGIMGGCFGPSKEQLQHIRQSISSNLAEFQQLISDKEFIDTYGTIQGDEHKRIPSEFQKTFEKESLIAKKQFYFVAKQNSSLLTSDDLLTTIMHFWQKALPLNLFLTKSL